MKRSSPPVTSALRAVEGLEAEASWFERQLIRLLRVTGRGRLRDRLRFFGAELPGEMAEEIFQG